jgi:hypothetical protein
VRNLKLCQYHFKTQTFCVAFMKLNLKTFENNIMSKIHSVQTICKNAGRNSIEVTAFCSLYVYSEQYGDTLTGPVIELGQQMLQDDL